MNSEGYFNVPMGRYINPDITQEDKILLMSKYLNTKGIRILCGDFTKAVRNAKTGDFVYFDPPYDYEDSGFTAYTADSFSRNDLLRLRSTCDKLIERGCRVLISNNDTTYVNSVFADSKYSITHITAKRMINCDGEKRDKVKEVLIYGRK